MSFKLPDLIVESVIRDGLNNVRRDETIIDDVFSELTRSYASKKYGAAELEKIKGIVKNKEVSIVHSFHNINANLPCISIQLADDREDEPKAHMGGFVSMIERPIEDPVELAKLVIAGPFTPISYESKSGQVRVQDAVDLSKVYANLLFIDKAGTKHPILGGIINEAGAKQFVIAKDQEVSLLSGAEIKSSLDYEIFQKWGNVEKTQLILGVHTQDALLTKYLYILLKYFVLSRRHDMIARGFEMSTYTGSDFNRNTEYGADVVYVRFLHLDGLVLHQWSSDKVQLVDSVDIKVKVAKDRLGNEALKLTNSTIKVQE